MSGGLLSDAFLHERLFRSEQLHGQLVVRRLEKGLQLVLDEALFARLRRAQRCRARLLLRGAVQRYIVNTEVHLQDDVLIRKCDRSIIGKQLSKASTLNERCVVIHYR